MFGMTMLGMGLLVAVLAAFTIWRVKWRPVRAARWVRAPVKGGPRRADR